MCTLGVSSDATLTDLVCTLSVSSDATLTDLVCTLNVSSDATLTDLVCTMDVSSDLIHCGKSSYLTYTAAVNKAFELPLRQTHAQC